VALVVLAFITKQTTPGAHRFAPSATPRRLHHPQERARMFPATFACARPNAPIAQDQRVSELSLCAGHSQSNRISSKSPSASELFDLTIERQQPLKHCVIPDPICFAAQHQQLAGSSSG
jgi:hypothetical protein